MKYMKTTGIYKGSNVEFNPHTRVGTSYGWWIVCKEIDGKMVFNDYGYSNTTRRHQTKLKKLLDTLGIKIDILIDAPKGLQALEDAVKHYEFKIANTKKDMMKPRTTLAKNAERAVLVGFYTLQIGKIERLIYATT